MFLDVKLKFQIHTLEIIINNVCLENEKIYVDLINGINDRVKGV